MDNRNKYNVSKRALAIFSVLIMMLWPIGVAALDPTDGSDAKEDADKDGLNNVDEFTWGTDPNNFDTDADLTPDGWEVHFRTVWYERQLDSKSQELFKSNYGELADNKQAQVREAISAEWSVFPLSPTNGNDAGVVAPEISSGAKNNPIILYGWIDADAQKYLNDPDEDGWNNLHEFLAGTDPTNPNTDGDIFTIDSQDPNPLIPDDYQSSQPGGTGSGQSDGQFQGPGNGHGGQGQGQGQGNGQGQGQGEGQGQGQGQQQGQGNGNGQGNQQGNENI